MPESVPAPPRRTAPEIVLAFDYGLRRIGAACGDTLSRSATPLAPVPAAAPARRWEIIDRMLREWQPQIVVVGLPYNADGSESALSAAARAFAYELEARCKLPVRLVDERYSSLEAQARLKDARRSGERKRRVARPDIDAAAACIILERWFTQTT